MSELEAAPPSSASPELFDSHCHLDFPALSLHLMEHLRSARDVGVSRWFVPGCRIEDCSALAEFRERLRPEFSVQVGFGLHPYFSDLKSDVEALGQQLVAAVRKWKPVAIGECGLDKNRGAPLTRQVELLEMHLQIAQECDLPIVLHQVGWRDEFIRAIERVGLPTAGALVHGFTGDAAWATGLSKRGLLLGFGGAITRPNRKRLHGAARETPLTSLLIETDAPDQSVTLGSESETCRNLGVPADLTQVCRKLSELRGTTFETVARQSFENAQRLFGS